MPQLFTTHQWFSCDSGCLFSMIAFCVNREWDSAKPEKNNCLLLRGYFADKYIVSVDVGKVVYQSKAVCFPTHIDRYCNGSILFIPEGGLKKRPMVPRPGQVYNTPFIKPYLVARTQGVCQKSTWLRIQRRNTRFPLQPCFYLLPPFHLFRYFSS